MGDLECKILVISEPRSLSEIFVSFISKKIGTNPQYIETVKYTENNINYFLEFRIAPKAYLTTKDIP